MEKIVAFLGENYWNEGEFYHAKPTSAAFLQQVTEDAGLLVLAPVTGNTLPANEASSHVHKQNFVAFPYYSSTKNFIVKSLTQKNFLKEFIKKCDFIINNDNHQIFWIRTPSIGAVIFGMRVLKYNKILINHMCADASNTWKDKKYSLIEKIFGFITSRLILAMLKKICSSPYTINLCTGDALEEFSKKANPENTHQFVDIMIKDVVSEINNSEVSLEENKQILNILFVGRIVEDKGIFELINAVAKKPNLFHLTIVGDGPDLAKCKNMIALKKVNNIIFTGQLAHSEISEAYNHSDVTIVPSNNYYEGFPRVIMESWYHGKPVIVSDVGGIKAFVKNETNGLIIDRGSSDSIFNALNRLYSDQELYDRLKAGAFNMKKICTQRYWVSIVREAIKEKVN